MRIAGVEVGKVTKVERADKGSDAVMVTMTVGKAGRPIHDDARAKIRPRIFLEGNFFVDLEPGTPGAPGDRRQRHDPDQPDRRAGPVRPAADLAAVRHARGPQDAARRVRQRARQGRRRGLQPLDPVLEERLPRHRDRQRGLAGRDRARPLGLRQERGRDGRGAGPPPRAAQEPDHRLQHDGRRVRPRAGQPARRDRRAAAHAARRPARARRAQRRPSRRCARSPPTCARACSPPRPRSTPRSRSCASCAAWSPRTSCAASPPTCARRSRRSPAWPARASRWPSRTASWRAARTRSSCRGPRTRSRTSSSRPRARSTARRRRRSRASPARAAPVTPTASGSACWPPAARTSCSSRPDTFGTTTNPILGANPPKPKARPPLDEKQPCENQESPDLRSQPADPPQQWQADTSSQAFKDRYDARQGPRRRLAQGPAQGRGARRQAQGHRRGRDARA